jgi:glycerol-3-phosphate O-acyltransferase
LSAAETIFGRYGRVSIQFGRPMALSEVRQSVTASDAVTLTPTERRRIISQLSHRVMREINAVTAVTPGALVALVLLGNERRGMPHAELLRRARWFAHKLEAEGARFSPRLSQAGAQGLREDALVEACEMHIHAGHVIAQRPSQRDANGVGRAGLGAIYRVPDEGRVFLSLAKNTLVHFLVERGLVALSLLGARAPSVSLPALLSDTQFLSKLFKLEFAFRSDAHLEVTVRGVLLGMQRDEELSFDDDTIRLPTDTGALGRYARALGEFVDGYLVAVRTALSLERPTVAKEYLRRCLRTGDQMFLTGEVDRREALSKPLMETALMSLIELGAVGRVGDDLRVVDTHLATNVQDRLLGFTPS